MTWTVSFKKISLAFQFHLQLPSVKSGMRWCSNSIFSLKDVSVHTVILLFLSERTDALLGTFLLALQNPFPPLSPSAVLPRPTVPFLRLPSLPLSSTLFPLFPRLLSVQSQGRDFHLRGFRHQYEDARRLFSCRSGAGTGLAWLVLRPVVGSGRNFVFSLGRLSPNATSVGLSSLIGLFAAVSFLDGGRVWGQRRGGGFGSLSSARRLSWYPVFSSAAQTFYRRGGAGLSGEGDLGVSVHLNQILNQSFLRLLLLFFFFFVILTLGPVLRGSTWFQFLSRLLLPPPCLHLFWRRGGE